MVSQTRTGEGEKTNHIQFYCGIGIPGCTGLSKRKTSDLGVHDFCGRTPLDFGRSGQVKWGCWFSAGILCNLFFCFGPFFVPADLSFGRLYAHTGKQQLGLRVLGGDTSCGFGRNGAILGCRTFVFAF